MRVCLVQHKFFEKISRSGRQNISLLLLFGLPALVSWQALIEKIQWISQKSSWSAGCFKEALL